MTNRYFNFTSPLQLIKDAFARSRWQNARLTEVQAGFAAVQAEMDLRAPALGSTLTNPTLLGNVNGVGASSFTVPTVSLSDPDMTKVASRQYVANAVGASGALLPPQAGNAGKNLQTDGTSATWEVVIPPQTGNAGKALMSDGTSQSWQYPMPATAGNAGKVPRVNAGATGYTLEALTGFTSGGLATHSGTTTADQRTVLDISASVAGTLVSLPDATTLPVGTSYLLSTRSGTNTAGLLDNDGNILTVANSSTGVGVILTNNATAAGTWKLLSSSLVLSSPPTAFQQIRAGAVNVSTSPSQNVKFMLPIGGNDFLLASGESGGHAVRLRWMRADGLQISEVANATLTAAGTAVNRIEILAMAGGSYVLIWRCTGSNNTHAVAFTLAGSTITTGSVVNVQAMTNTNPATGGHYGLAWSAAANGDTVLMLLWAIGTPGITMVAFSVAGTAITVGTKVDVRATGANFSYGSVAACTTADKWIVTYGTDIASAGAYAFIATAVGLVLTQNTEQLINSTCGAVAVAVASATKAWAIHLPKNSSAPLIYPIDITGNAVAIGTGAAFGYTLNSTHPNVLGVHIEVFPSDVLVVDAYCDTTTTNAHILVRGSVASGAFVSGAGWAIGVTTYNQFTAINRLGDLGIAHAAGVVDGHVYLFRASTGTEEQMLSFTQISHLLGANAKNASVILLPDDRLVLVNQATGTNVAVYAAKIGGFP